MKEILMTITSKGQVTIPAEVRRYLGLEKNQKIALVIEEETGTVCLKAPRYPDVASLRGAAGKLAREFTWDEMRAISREDRAREDRAREDRARAESTPQEPEHE
jgi:antitoxin PrlF